MNYELAKKLKDAGFPIKSQEVEVRREPMHVGGERIFTPTLSELIEACGDDFYVLLNLVSVESWTAESFDPKQIQIGSTPEEAAARLWLALNRK